MTFKECLKKLNISDYGRRIFNSNSHGELMHLNQYYILATTLDKNELAGFRAWFVETVEAAKEEWERPASVYQHILRLAYKKEK